MLCSAWGTLQDGASPDQVACSAVRARTASCEMSASTTCLFTGPVLRVTGSRAECSLPANGGYLQGFSTSATSVWQQPCCALLLRALRPHASALSDVPDSWPLLSCRELARHPTVAVSPQTASYLTYQRAVKPLSAESGAPPVHRLHICLNLSLQSLPAPLWVHLPAEHAPTACRAAHQRCAAAAEPAAGAQRRCQQQGAAAFSAAACWQRCTPQAAQPAQAPPLQQQSDLQPPCS